jgi:phosphoesterase RecJ-like protein
MINDHISPSESVEKAKVMAKFIADLQATRNKQIVWVKIDKQATLNVLSEQPIEKLTSNLASSLRALREVRVSIVFYERPDNSIKVSLRGRPNIDVLSVASKFGGGGHLEAAGCILEGLSLDESVSIILKEVEKLKLN